MKIDYKKKIEKMKKELQSVQVAITEPDLIFIDYVEEGKYKIDYRFVGGSAVYFWDKLRDCIIPEGYKGMVLVDLVKSKFVCKFIFQLCGFIYATFIFKRFD